MLDALTATEAGMLNDVQRLHTISHNLANTSTVGFKKEMAVARSFADRLDANAAHATRPVVTRHVDHTDGALKYTGNPLDVGLEGSGFFVVSTPIGEAYTRQGNFRVDVNGRLVTSNGHSVLGIGGDIQLTGAEPRIDAQGSVWEGQTEVGRLRLVTVRDPASLVPAGNGLWQATETSEFEDSGLRVRQGFTEAANVVTMTEMIKMIETVRHFETSQRLIRGYDGMLDTAINVGGET